jgi:tetratricopeptide (TPR) repeat protein
MMHEELDHWRAAWANGSPGALDYAPSIEADLQRLQSDYTDSDSTVAAMLDAINYYTKRTWWNRAAIADWRNRVEATALAMQQIAPRHRLTLRAKIDLARARDVVDLDGSLALLDEVIEAATDRGEESIVIDALFNKASVLNKKNMPAHARGIWQTMLRKRALDPLLEGEVHIHIGLTYTQQRFFDRAMYYFRKAKENERYPDSVRACGMSLYADCLVRFKRMDEAIAELDRLIELYPETDTAKTAIRIRQQWSTWRRH